MTTLRIYATDKPSLVGARVLPMSEEDRSFWSNVRSTWRSDAQRAERREHQFSLPLEGV